jgi:hypothetical protein
MSFIQIKLIRILFYDSILSLDIQSEIDKDDTYCFSSFSLLLNRQMMANSIDRQSVLDNLTAIETTAKLLLNAFVNKNNDAELALNGIHRDELIDQTTSFLSEARKSILNHSKTLNLSIDWLFDQKNLPNESNNDEG